MHRLIPIALLALASSSGLADSPYVLIFQSAKLRATEGWSRQQARDALAREELKRVSWLLGRGAASREEYELARATAAVAALELRLAETRVKHAALSLDVALSLDKHGRRVPLCRRKRQTDDNKAVPLLKKLTAKRPLPKLALDPPNTGTKMQIPDPEPPKPPEKPPVVTPEPLPPVPKPPTPTPEVDPPEPSEKPKPEKPKPGKPKPEKP